MLPLQTPSENCDSASLVKAVLKPCIIRVFCCSMWLWGWGRLCLDSAQQGCVCRFPQWEKICCNPPSTSSPRSPEQSPLLHPWRSSASTKSTWGPSTPPCQLAFKAWPLCTVIILWLHLGDLPFTALQHPHWSYCISLIRQVCTHATGWETCRKLRRGYTKWVTSWGDSHGLESC